jgi:tetratricopeptide (TPR) repeat protein
MLSRSSILLLVVAALAACSSTPPAQPPDDPPPIDAPPPDAVAPASSAEVDQAIGHIKAGRFADAVPLLEKALATNPRDAQAHYYLAVSLEETGKKGDAERHYKDALAADPGLVEASQNLAAIYLDEPPRPKDAIQVLKAALAKAPGHPKLLHNLGFALGLDGDVDGAVKAYEQVIAKEDGGPVRFALGSLLFEAKRYDAAVPHLRKAAEATPDDVASLATIARMMGHAKAFTDCVKLLDQAIAKKADAAELWVRRGLCKHELGDEPGAAAHYYRGVSLAAQKKNAEARKALKQAAELGKGTPIGKQAEEKLKTVK